MPRKAKKLSLGKETLKSVAGGPGHRTTNRCTANEWQTCQSYCQNCQTCDETACMTACVTNCGDCDNSWDACGSAGPCETYNTCNCPSYGCTC